MVNVPCILCYDISEAEDKNAIAKICDRCNNGNLYNILRNVNSKQIKDFGNTCKVKTIYLHCKWCD